MPPAGRTGRRATGEISRRLLVPSAHPGSAAAACHRRLHGPQPVGPGSPGGGSVHRSQADPRGTLRPTPAAGALGAEGAEGAERQAEGAERQAEVNALVERLALPVQRDLDSFGMLSAWLAAGPKEDTSLRAAVRVVSLNNQALADLDITCRGNLLGSPGGWLTPRIEAVLDELDERLRPREHARPEGITRFNRDARQIVAEQLPEAGKSRGPSPWPTRPRRSPRSRRWRRRWRLAAGDLLSVEVTVRRRQGGGWAT